MTSERKLIQVPDDQTGQRLDRVLAAHVAELSRSRLKALIEAGTVTIDGATIRDPSHRVKSGAAIALDIPPPQPAAPAAETIPLNVVYEDADIIVIDKPSGLVVHPAAGHWTGTLVNALIAHCGESLSGIGGERRPGIVHRLDKDTSGLMVVAKNDRAHRRLAAQFAAHGRDGRPFERGYLAFVWDAPDRPRGTVDRPIDRHKSVRTRMAIQEGGREAVTHWQLIERFRTSKGTQKAKGKADFGGKSSGLHAGNRPDAPNSGAFGLDRAPPPRRWCLRDRLPQQGGPIAPSGPSCPEGPWQTGPACPYVSFRAPGYR